MGKIFRAVFSELLEGLCAHPIKWYKLVHVGVLGCFGHMDRGKSWLLMSCCFPCFTQWPGHETKFCHLALTASYPVASGNLKVCCGKWPFSIGTSTNYMAICHSKPLNYQRLIHIQSTVVMAYFIIPHTPMDFHPKPIPGPWENDRSPTITSQSTRVNH